jgi:Dihaem cytochrome c
MNRANLSRYVHFAAAALAAGLLHSSHANAEDKRYFPAVRDVAVMKECAACHMAFPAAMLPARSWRKLTAGLDDHFGENASLDAATTKRITDYLVANAADAGGRNARLLRGLDRADTPLRISDMPWWIRAHRDEVRPGAFKDPRVGSKANCVACHRRAARGVFDDD